MNIHAQVEEAVAVYFSDKKVKEIVRRAVEAEIRENEEALETAARKHTRTLLKSLGGSTSDQE